MKEVPFEQVTRYSSLKVDWLENNVYRVSDMVEKPATQELAFSNYSVLGRCVLPPEIFQILEVLPKGAGGEYQLTDAMKILAQKKRDDRRRLYRNPIRHGQQAGNFTGDCGDRT